MPTTAPAAHDRPAGVPPDLQRIGVRPSLRVYLRDVWARREFAFTVAVGELRAQNQNSVLGSLWHLLNPLFLAGVFYLIFGVILRVDRGTISNYPAFLITGVFTFYFSQKVIMAGSRVVVANHKLIQNVQFPRALLPIASVLQESLAQLPALAAMLVIVLLTGEQVRATWLLLVPIWLVQSVFNLGLSLIAARLTFHFRDTEKILPYLLRIWFYLSGIFFGIEFVADGVEDNGTVGEVILFLFELNPLYGFIRLTREAVLEGTTEWAFWRNVLVWALAAALLGFAYFRQREEQYSRV